MSQSGCQGARRAGFTLIEIMVSLVLVGTIALLVYGAATAAVSTQRTLEQRRAAVQTERAWHAVLSDVLRNARPGAIGDTTFQLVSDVDLQGKPRDRLRFVTAGSVPPLTADSDWDVVLTSSSEGLVLVARPLGVRAPARRIIAFPEVTGFDVRVMTTGRQRAWVDEWRFARTVPSAVELTYWTDDGPITPSKRLTLPLGGVQ